MFIIDFNAAKADILSNIPNRDVPQWAVPVFNFITQWFDESTEGFMVQTSGSTGTPKQISHSREAMTASAEKTCNFFGLKKNDTALLAMPATFIGGKMMIVRSIVRGLKLIVTEPQSNPLAGFSFDNKIDFAAFTPMQMSMILNKPDTAQKLSCIKTIILGGGEVSYALVQQLQNISSSVYETYGMTETISHVAVKKINGPDRSGHFTVLDGVSISTDERGCLVIDAPHLNARHLVTNDLVHIFSEKEFQWLGRYDNIINSGGIKIAAEDVERKLHPFVDVNFFVAGTTDEVLGQKVTLVLEATSADGHIRQGYEAVLSKYEKPRAIVTIEKFSYTENEKINKRRTLERLTLK